MNKHTIGSIIVYSMTAILLIISAVLFGVIVFTFPLKSLVYFGPILLFCFGIWMMKN